jgi:hypothetical protein
MSANPLPSLLNPSIDVADTAVAYWLRQVTLRLRREVSWCWAVRGGQAGNTGLPPLRDAAAENLDLTRYDADKRNFFLNDVTALYLTEQLQPPPPSPNAQSARGSWEWVARELALSDAAQFSLALALAARLDSALGAVCSACLNDASRPYPTLALAQRLWDDPNEILALADGAHPLFRHGLLSWSGDAAPGLEWHQPLDLHAWLAQTLIDPKSALPPVLEEVRASATVLNEDQQIVGRRLASASLTAMQIVPLLGAKDADYAGLAGALARQLDRRLGRVRSSFQPERQSLTALAALAWLRGFDLVMPEQWPARQDAHKHHEHWFTPVLSTPVRWYIPISDPGACNTFPPFALAPLCRLPTLTYAERRQLIRDGLGSRALALESVIAEAARRFRFERHAIERVLCALPQDGLTGHALLAACRTEALSEFGHLAQPVASRFELDELVLPPAQAQQIDEIRQSMNALTTVHYGWGTARAWNEGGLAVLFGGPPGTELPMYRIDLSQVVNKYIGETEKNLKRIFDAAELADCILFFDEADALFGKRTEVKDAHDRFANIEISYLLERMERFKGLAILATNRRKDLDEAFMRRLRCVVEFPLPGIPERERLWRGVFPANVNTSELDFRYLARQFALSGGHIRSIAFNACLLSAAHEVNGEVNDARVTMSTVVVAVKRELDKLNRVAGEELFGAYAPMVREHIA